VYLFDAPLPPTPSVVHALQSYWTTFAKTGDPNSSGLLAWPRYSPDNDAHLVLAAPLRAGSALAKAERVRA
jgi:para-nitrobenzyl esterase